MPLNKSTGNMYEFITHTWNTIKGECPHGCSYCYMKRWGKQHSLHLDEKEFKTDLGKENFIFVGSSCDMFADDIPYKWIKRTLDYCNEYSGNNYLLQTKNPDRFSSFFNELKSHFCICTTLETNRIYKSIMNNSPSPQDRALTLSWVHSIKKYITIEPIMDFDLPEFVELIKVCNPVQVNIGADSSSKHNKLPEPSKEKILELIAELGNFTKVVQKKNLKRLLK